MQPHAMIERDVADLGRDQAAHGQRVAATAGDDRASRLGHRLGQQLRLGRGDPDGLARTAGDELLHGAVGEQLAAADHDQVIRGVLHLRHQVAGHEHRAALGRQRLHQVADPQDPLGIQPVDRLVEHEQGRVTEQRGGDAEPLAHAEREPLGALARHLGQADQLEHLAHPPLGQVIRLGQAEQVVVGGPAPVHRLGVDQRAHLAHRIRQVRVVLAADGDVAGVRVVQAKDQPHGSGLAGSVRAKKARHRARRHAERQVVDGDFVAVPFAEPPYLNHRMRPLWRPALEGAAMARSAYYLHIAG